MTERCSLYFTLGVSPQRLPPARAACSHQTCKHACRHARMGLFCGSAVALGPELQLPPPDSSRLKPQLVCLLWCRCLCVQLRFLYGFIAFFW